MNSGMLHEKNLSFSMHLADGSRFLFQGEDTESQKIIFQLAKIMQLPPCDNDCGNNATRIIASKDKKISDNPKVVFFSKKQVRSENKEIAQVIYLSLALIQKIQNQGGFLLHGALAEWNGLGVILAASGGTGKTTASRRLPPTWRSLSDDVTLVIPDSKGIFWAHPWPTWSQFIYNGTGSTWNVQNAVPLEMIFFLTQSSLDEVEPLAKGKAVTLLLEAAKQASRGISLDLSKVQKQECYLQIFNNLCNLVHVVPGQILRLSLTGRFWELIETTLKRDSYEKR